MITIKSATDIARMRDAGRIAGNALALAGRELKAGMTTKELDTIIYDYIVKCGAKPSFLGYGGFPASACISVNNEVIHGIPSSKTVFKEGDIVSIDVGAFYKGFHGDTAATFGVGKISEQAQQLLDVTKHSLELAIGAAVPGARIGDVSSTVEEYCRSFGYGVVKKYCGHGVGRKLHEEPEVPNYGTKGHGQRLLAGMTIAVEPMINIKGDDVRVLKDGWTVVTRSGSLSAHFEHSIAIATGGAIVLTAPDI